MTINRTDIATEMVSIVNTQLPLHPLLITRHSQGAFSSAEIPPSSITRLLHAARCAPSAGNSQPWQFIVIRQGPSRKEIDADLTEWGSAWATSAPVLIAVIADLDAGVTLNGLNYAIFDCGLATQNLLLQATDLGMAAHPVGFKDRWTVERLLHLPDSYQLLLFVALGYPAEGDAQTHASRYRKPLEAVAFWDTWDGALVMD